MLRLPDLTGRLALVTGASAGLGFATADALAGAGGEVVLAVRNPQRGEAARQAIAEHHPRATTRLVLVDTSSLASVRACADALVERGRPIDMLINNAGINRRGKRTESVDGYELHFATNYLGHFALTARLLPLLRGGRVVSVGSLMATRQHLDLDDLCLTRGYSSAKAYARSKLACLCFARELQRRSDERGWEVTSVAAHPGWSTTSLMRQNRTAVTARGRGSLGDATLAALRVAQPAAQGARPLLLAAAGAAQPGGYYGPAGGFQLAGDAVSVDFPAGACDDTLNAELFDASIRLAEQDFVG